MLRSIMRYDLLSMTLRIRRFGTTDRVRNSNDFAWYNTYIHPNSNLGPRYALFAHDPSLQKNDKSTISDLKDNIDRSLSNAKENNTWKKISKIPILDVIRILVFSLFNCSQLPANPILSRPPPCKLSAANLIFR